ncbi:MAG: relaxase/mobilization nuclease domain-containing protein [Oscillospiraceae bacterium]|nr:relaxase/mobilization nuclease domain-containing protein [Oscillospiraceae bacterium]
MATTRIISMHINKGKTIAQCLTDRTDYAKNPEKTAGGELISAYACDPHTADAEYLFSKRQYKTITGREQKNDVIAYQVRQSFKPGEVTPEEANKVGYEFAARLLKGNHAFIVATHIDKRHIHNHIIWNSTTLDCTHKFRDFLGSGRAVARLSDTVCLEHKLSVIENPKRHSRSAYNKWSGYKKTPSHRELLLEAIDAALAKKPETFEVFLALLQDAGYTVKRGANVTVCHTGQKNIRLRSLKGGYTEDEIRAIISGQKTHTPRKKHAPDAVKKSTLLIDIQAKLDAGKGAGYANWANKYNLKQMAQTVLYLQDHNLADLSELAAKVDSATGRFDELSDEIKNAEKRMAEIAVLKTHIVNYAKTRDVFAGYKASKYSKKYLAEHEADIQLHRAAKTAFNDLGLKKLPTVKSLQTEYAELLSKKKVAYPEYRKAREEMRELLIHQKNVEQILNMNEHTVSKEKEHGRE